MIRTKLAAGEPDQQILDEFVASYGDSILTEPPKRGISLGVWLGPADRRDARSARLGCCSCAPGGARRATASGSASASVGLDPDVADELHRFREEFGR